MAAALCLVAMALVTYTYAGYPLLVGLWSRIAPFPVRGRRDYEPTVSVCLAVFNGKGQLADKLRNLQSLEYPASKLEFLVYSDGSTDGTEGLLRELAAADPRLRFVCSSERLGKPTALNRLVGMATGEVLLMCDVRQTLSRGALRELLVPLSDRSVGCVSGSLVLAGDTGAGAYWHYEHLIRKAEARLGGMVGVSGSLYVVRREDMPELPADILLDDMFVPLSVVLARGRRTVLASSAEAYDVACDDEREFRRKVRTLAGNYQLVAKMPWLLVPGRSPVWFQLLSHKVLRLACPLALVVLFWASGGLALRSTGSGPLVATWGALFSAQVAFYALAIAGAGAGRLGRLARTFLVLNAAAVLGFVRFARGSQPVTW